MSYATRTRICSNCSKPFTGKLPPTRPVQCLECSITAAALNAVQLHNRSGPAYDRWAKAMAKVAAMLNT